MNNTGSTEDQTASWEGSGSRGGDNELVAVVTANRPRIEDRQSVTPKTSAVELPKSAWFSNAYQMIALSHGLSRLANPSRRWQLFELVSQTGFATKLDSKHPHARISTIPVSLTVFAKSPTRIIALAGSEKSRLGIFDENADRGGECDDADLSTIFLSVSDGQS